MKNPRTVGIIQARMGSTRLPGKVLAELGGRPVLAWVVQAADAAPGIDRAVVATSDRPGDDPVADWCAANGIPCHRGPEDDVLARFVLAAKAEAADLIMRLTADCPLLDPQVCGQVVTLLKHTGADYACNFDPRSWPDGLDCEIFTAALLQEAADNTCQPFEREHVTPYMRANRHRIHVAQATCPIPGVANERWTLDEHEDLEFLRAVVARLPNADRPPSWLEVLDVMDAAPKFRRTHEMARDTGAVPQQTPAVPAGPRFETSHRMLERARAVIPLGSQTFSKSFTQYPKEAPLFLAGGDGARVWDVDGNCYVDLVSGLLPVVLGYRDSDVDDAIRRQLCNGISFSLATELEIELAERLVEIIPCAELVRFGKNGTDATSAAVRLARAFTGRDRVAVCGYHGWQDWYIGSTLRNKGVPRVVSDLTHAFPYDDLAALEAVLANHRGEFAAVVIEPVNIAEPAPGYLEGVKDIAHAHGALLVFDEIVTGFRVAIGGAQELFGVTPDLACFGKAMGNGMPISAIVGRANVMREMEEVFFSGTFGGETLSLAAAIATIDKMRSQPVIERLWETGAALANGAERRIAAHGLSDTVGFGGLAPWKILIFRDHEQASAAAMKTVFVREMLRNGVLVNASHNVTFSLDDSQQQEILTAYDRALAVLTGELEQRDLDSRLGNDLIQPIFSVRPST
jgi:glutamate-1-semialdehyde 2,1-aminomutase